MAGIRTLLDWRGREHWSDRARPCRRCGRDTHLRDDDGLPCHKVCAEAEIDGARPPEVSRG